MTTFSNAMQGGNTLWYCPWWTLLTSVVFAGHDFCSMIQIFPNFSAVKAQSLRYDLHSVSTSPDVTCPNALQPSRRMAGCIAYFTRTRRILHQSLPCAPTNCDVARVSDPGHMAPLQPAGPRGISHYSHDAAVHTGSHVNNHTPSWCAVHQRHNSRHDVAITRTTAGLLCTRQTVGPRWGVHPQQGLLCSVSPTQTIEIFRTAGKGNPS
jgi:hypothetical protein